KDHQFSGIMDPYRNGVLPDAGSHNSPAIFSPEQTPGFPGKDPEIRADQPSVFSKSQNASVIMSAKRHVSSPFQIRFQIQGVMGKENGNSLPVRQTNLFLNLLQGKGTALKPLVIFSGNAQSAA